MSSTSKKSRRRSRKKEKLEDQTVDSTFSNNSFPPVQLTNLVGPPLLDVASSTIPAGHQYQHDVLSSPLPVQLNRNTRPPLLDVASSTIPTGQQYQHDVQTSPLPFSPVQLNRNTRPPLLDVASSTIPAGHQYQHDVQTSPLSFPPAQLNRNFRPPLLDVASSTIPAGHQYQHDVRTSLGYGQHVGGIQIARREFGVSPLSHPEPMGLSGTDPFRNPREIVPTLDGNSDKYPNAGVELGEESLLPNHPDFRPSMKFPSPGRSCDLPKPKSRKALTKEDAIARINSKVDEIIEKLTSKGKFLPQNVVRDITKKLTDKECTIRIHWKEIEVYNEYSKLHGRVEELIKVYCMFTPVTTLHDLGLALAKIENVNSYEDLRLGPLVKHPNVQDYFKPPCDMATPPELSIYQLHKHLMHMMNKSKRGEKFKLEDYLEFMRKKEGLDSVSASLC